MGLKLFDIFQLSDPSDLPKNAFSIFLLLVEHLCVEHIDYALEIGLSGMNDPAVEGRQQLKVAHIVIFL